MKVKGVTVGVEVVVDAQTGELLGLDIITQENSEAIRSVLQQVMAEVQGEVLVSDNHSA